MSDFPEPLEGDMAHRRAQVDETDISKVRTEVLALDPLNDRHWNPLGMPQLTIVRNMTGLLTLSRAELTDFTDSYNREAAAKRHKVNWSPDPATPDFDDGDGLDPGLTDTPAAAVTADALKDMVTDVVKDVVKDALREMMAEANADKHPQAEAEPAKVEGAGANDNGAGDDPSNDDETEEPGKTPAPKPDTKPTPKTAGARPKNAPK